MRVSENDIEIFCMELHYRTYVFWTESISLHHEIPFGRLQTGRDEKEATEWRNVVLVRTVRFVIYLNL